MDTPQNPPAPQVPQAAKKPDNHLIPVVAVILGMAAATAILAYQFWPKDSDFDTSKMIFKKKTNTNANVTVNKNTNTVVTNSNANTNQ